MSEIGNAGILDELYNSHYILELGNSTDTFYPSYQRGGVVRNEFLLGHQ